MSQGLHLKLTSIVNFGTLTPVVKLLLLGHAGSLLSGAYILSGLREDFLQDVGKLTRPTGPEANTYKMR